MKPDDVLVVTVRKGFWASPESEVFPRRLFTPELRGPSHAFVNSGLLLLRAFIEIRRRPPRLVLVGYAHRVAPWLAWLRSLRLLRGARLVITNRKGLPDTLASYVDAIIEYSRRELEPRPQVVRERSVFVPLPANGDFDRLGPPPYAGTYIFSGGGGLRDFRSAIEAVRGLDVRLVIVTFSPETWDFDGELPPNVEVRWRMPLQEFLATMAGSLFVLLPLKPGIEPHGQTTVVQALRLEKALVTTRNASLEDYVADGQEGLLVDAGDVDGYRCAVERLVGDDQLRCRLEAGARERVPELTFEAFARRLAALCEEVLGRPA
jgi:glycosyltransferase involved in cell wall biosynthesis